MRRISKDITKHYQMACSSGELHAIYFLWAHVFYVFILPFLYYYPLNLNHLQGNTHNKYHQWYQQNPIRMGRPTPYTVSNEA